MVSRRRKKISPKAHVANAAAGAPRHPPVVVSLAVMVPAVVRGVATAQFAAVADRAPMSVPRPPSHMPVPQKAGRMAHWRLRLHSQPARLNSISM